ncbi:MAG: helix-turn-helix transcriptional regulator [Bacteriovoracaceae bacterium]
MISKQLEKLMKASRIKTLSGLAEKTSISKSALHGYLNGVEPSLKNLVTLADYFHVSLDYLVGKTNNHTMVGECRDDSNNLYRVHIVKLDEE